jgi:DNA-binding transcriptional LysR family regulator
MVTHEVLLTVKLLCDNGGENAQYCSFAVAKCRYVTVTGYDWNDLRFFLEVARTGTLSGAARIMGTDHATVGRRINALERALGQTLFQRSLSGYALTLSGESLLVHVEQMEVLALRSAEGTTQPGIALAGVVRLTAPDGLGNFFLARYLHRFVSAYPGLSLQLVAIQQVQTQSQREGDVAVTLTPGRGHLVTEKLVDYGLGLYASREYLARQTHPKTTEELRGHRLVGYVDDLLFSRELDYLGDVLPGLRAQVQSASLFAQASATQSGAGICVLPHYLARQFTDLTAVLPGVVELRRSYWLNVSADAVHIPRVRAVCNFVKEFVVEGNLD